MAKPNLADQIERIVTNGLTYQPLRKMGEDLDSYLSLMDKSVISGEIFDKYKY